MEPFALWRSAVREQTMPMWMLPSKGQAAEDYIFVHSSVQLVGFDPLWSNK